MRQVQVQVQVQAQVRQSKRPHPASPQKFDTFLEKFRFLHPGLLMNSRTYLNFQV